MLAFRKARKPVVDLGETQAEHTELHRAPTHEENEPRTQYQVPIWAQTLLRRFPVFMGLAEIAALWYFEVTLPGHLGGGAGAAP